MRAPQVHARQLRAEQAEAERRRQGRVRLLFWSGLLIIIGLLTAIVVVAVNSARPAGGGSAPTTDGPLVTPAIATADGALRMGPLAAPVTVQVYVDYLCPYCGRFERANGAELATLVRAGTVRLELHPVSFLDRASAGTRYSTRAANAVATVAAQAPEQVLAFNAALFAEQPQEGAAGLTDDELARIAAGAGVPQAVISDFARQRFVPWVALATKQAFGSGVTGTPTVKIDGVAFTGDLYTAGPLSQAIAAAAAQ